MVVAFVQRIQKVAGGILAARNAGARLCKLGSFIATGAARDTQNPCVTLASLAASPILQRCQQQRMFLRLRPKAWHPKVWAALGVMVPPLGFPSLSRRSAGSLCAATSHAVLPLPNLELLMSSPAHQGAPVCIRCLVAG